MKGYTDSLRRASDKPRVALSVEPMEDDHVVLVALRGGEPRLTYRMTPRQADRLAEELMRAVDLIHTGQVFRGEDGT